LTRRWQGKKGETKQKGWFVRYLRTIAFILCFNILLGFILLYRALAYFSKSTWENSGTKWVTCLMGGGTTATCGAIPEEHPNYSLWVALHFAVAGQGIVNFLIYGLQLENFLYWGRWIGQLLHIERCAELKTQYEKKQIGGQAGGSGDKARKSTEFSDFNDTTNTTKKKAINPASVKLQGVNRAGLGTDDDEKAPPKKKKIVKKKKIIKKKSS